MESFVLDSWGYDVIARLDFKHKSCNLTDLLTNHYVALVLRITRRIECSDLFSAGDLCEIIFGQPTYPDESLRNEMVGELSEVGPYDPHVCQTSPRSLVLGITVLSCLFDGKRGTVTTSITSVSTGIIQPFIMAGLN